MWATAGDFPSEVHEYVRGEHIIKWMKRPSLLPQMSFCSCGCHEQLMQFIHLMDGTSSADGKRYFGLGAVDAISSLFSSSLFFYVEQKYVHSLLVVCEHCHSAPTNEILRRARLQ